MVLFPCINPPNTVATAVAAKGLTKVPIDGQPPSIVQELDDMARQYVKSDNAIILAVTPANADLATSDALRMARDVDPSGDRTIGEQRAELITWQGQSRHLVVFGCTRNHSGWCIIACCMPFFLK